MASAGDEPIVPLHPRIAAGSLTLQRSSGALDPQAVRANAVDDVPSPVPDHRTAVKQRCIVGAHGNIGGGGTSEPATGSLLSLLAREWIVDRAVATRLVVDSPAVLLEEPSEAVRSTDLREDGLRPPPCGGLSSPSGEVSTTVEEALNHSVLRRWDDADRPVRPRNLGHAE